MFACKLGYSFQRMGSFAVFLDRLLEKARSVMWCYGLQAIVKLQAAGLTAETAVLFSNLAATSLQTNRLAAALHYSHRALTVRRVSTRCRNPACCVLRALDQAELTLSCPVCCDARLMGSRAPRSCGDKSKKSNSWHVLYTAPGRVH